MVIFKQLIRGLVHPINTRFGCFFGPNDGIFLRRVFEVRSCCFVDYFLALACGSVAVGFWVGPVGPPFRLLSFILFSF